jgi:hypothetical protein
VLKAGVKSLDGGGIKGEAWTEMGKKEDVGAEDDVDSEQRKATTLTSASGRGRGRRRRRGRAPASCSP